MTSQPLIIGRIEPQPPRGIKYMLGAESWLPADKQSPLLLHCEEWGNLGPMELNAEIPDNGHGFRVRTSTFLAPPGAVGFAEDCGVYYWVAGKLERGSKRPALKANPQYRPEGQKHADEYGKFSAVQNPAHPRPDLCGFIVLDRLLPNPGRSIVSAAEHDEIWLDADCDKLAKVATDEDILLLVRCGIRYDSEMDSLAMFA